MEELNHAVMHICTQSFITKTASLLFDIFLPVQKMVQAAPSGASCNWWIRLEESNFAFCALHSQLSFPISRALFTYCWWSQGIAGRRTHGRVAPTHIKTHQSSNKHTSSDRSKESPNKQQIHKPPCPCGRKLLLVKEAPRVAQTQAGTEPLNPRREDEEWWAACGTAVAAQGSASLSEQHSHFGTSWADHTIISDSAAWLTMKMWLQDITQGR